MAKILKEIDFKTPIKLEVGSGASPVPGYVHCDVNEDNPDLYIQCKMGTEPLPVPDECCSEILSNHSIEHVSWLDLEFLVQDWHRALMPGGKLFLRTPDLEFICRNYLDGTVTKEHPTDERNMQRIFGGYGPSEWTNIKLFAGQNYPGNTHYFCLDFKMLRALLLKNGFVGIERLHDQVVYSPGEICAIAFKPC